MADFTYDAPADEQAPTGTRIATLTNWAGAAVSLALIAGVGVWGYKLVMRDVTGIPVVQAMEGPMRIAPEDPGGTLARPSGACGERRGRHRACRAGARSVAFGAPACRAER